jgi:hypothetical protein
MLQFKICACNSVSLATIFCEFETFQTFFKMKIHFFVHPMVFHAYRLAMKVPEVKTSLSQDLNKFSSSLLLRNVKVKTFNRT